VTPSVFEKSKTGGGNGPLNKTMSRLCMVICVDSTVFLSNLTVKLDHRNEVGMLGEGLLYPSD